MDYHTIPAAELKKHLLAAIQRKDRTTIAEIKAALLARAANIIASHPDDAAVEKLCKAVAKIT